MPKTLTPMMMTTTVTIWKTHLANKVRASATTKAKPVIEKSARKIEGDKEDTMMGILQNLRRVMCRRERDRRKTDNEKY